MPADASQEHVLTLSCPDRRGIVHAVAGYLAEHGGNILDSQQFGDHDSGLFFMRVHFAAEEPASTPDRLRTEFAGVAERFGMTWSLHDTTRHDRVVVMVSRLGHCLNDLLFRHASGTLGADVVTVVSNHQDLAPLAAAHRIPFIHLPVSPETRDAQEAELLDLVARERVDLVVLARYMQILSPRVCERLPGRIINIHHSFLPSFAGARPYHQAHSRGVKVIGATAHYVTAELDAGPIIEQEVTRVDHTFGPGELTAAGRDVECLALARAVRWHVDHRVLLNGSRTVVFR